MCADVQGQVDCDLTGLQPNEVLALTARSSGHSVDWSPTGEEPEQVTVRAPRPDEDLLAVPPQDALGDLLSEVERLARDGDADRLAPRLDELLARVRAGQVRPPAPAPPALPDAAVRSLDLLLFRLRTREEPEVMVPRVAELRALLREHGLALARMALAKLTLDPPDEEALHDALVLELTVALGNLLLRAMGEALRREDVAVLPPLCEEAKTLGVELHALAEGRAAFERAGMALFLGAHRLLREGERWQAFQAFKLELTATVVPPPGPMPSSVILGGHALREGDPVLGRDGEEIEGMRVVEIRPRSVRLRWEDTDHLLVLPAR